MPLRALLRFLTNNEQVIQKLADSYPIRRAAQLTAYVFHRGKELGQESLEKMQDEAKHTGKRLDSFKTTFTKELKDGLKVMDEEIKKKR